MAHIFKTHFNIARKLFVGIQLDTDLIYKTTNTGNKFYPLIGIAIEEDKEDPTLKVMTFSFFCLFVSIGIS